MKKLFITSLFIPFLLQANQDKSSLLENMLISKINFDTTYLKNANINNSDGSVQITKNRLQLNNSLIRVGYTNWKFDWDNVSSLPFGNNVSQPIEHMHSIDLALTKSYRISEKWFSLNSIFANSTFEDNMSDSFAFGASSFASYSINDDHSIGLGLFGKYHPVSSTVLPIASYSYRANSKDGLQVMLGFPQTHVGYHVNPDTLLRLGFTFSNSLIRLSDSSTIEKKGYSEFQDYMTNIGISYDINKKIKLMTDVLYTLKRDYTIYNKDGEELSNYEIDPTTGIMFKIVFEL